MQLINQEFKHNFYKMIYDVIVIGGGAAGMACAATAAKRGLSVVLLEKMEKCGRKIRITGKGRCNITNNKDRDTFLSKVRAGAEFIAPAFDAFNNFALVDMFYEMGLELKAEQGGRVYPAKGDAWDVVRTLERELKRLGVHTRLKSEVKGIITDKSNSQVLGVELSNDRVSARSVVIATGGVSYPSTGSTGDGYKFAFDLGHTIVPLMPALVPFEVSYPFHSSLKGLVLKNIAIKLEINGTEVAQEIGEVEFFNFGIGGGAIYRLSREAVSALYDGSDIDFVIDMKQGLSQTKLEGRVSRELEAKPTLKCSELLRKLVPQKIVSQLLNYCNLSPNMRVSQLSKHELNSLIDCLKKFRLPVITNRGFKEAVITVGGVSTNEVNPITMESLKVKGLYFAGEVLDIDADTGGYNLQLAFTTAVAAGMAISSQSQQTEEED